jgi:hypothetical protein
MNGSMRKGLSRRRWLLGPVISVAAFLVLDQTVARAIFSLDVFQNRTLPPFAESLGPDQERWLQTISGSEADRTNRIFTVDAELGWTNAPYGDAHEGGDTTNSRGFRGQREYAVPKPNGITRLACYGDSYTWGADGPDNTSFPAAMERITPDLEAINLGVSAYGTDQALMRFRRDGTDLGADHVVIGIMVENIGRNVNRYRPLWVPSSAITCVKPRFLLEGEDLVIVTSPFSDMDEVVAAVRDGSVLERTAEHEYWRNRSWLRPLFVISPTARQVGGVYARRERSVESMWRDQEGEPYLVTRAILRTFHAEALAGGAKSALVVLFPNRGAMHQVYEGGSRYWSNMLLDLADSGVDVLDLTDALREAHLQSGKGPKRLPMFSLRDHLRPHYNEVVAQAIVTKLGLESDE